MEHWEAKELRAKKIAKKQQSKRITMFDRKPKATKHYRIAELRCKEQE